jgi:hypothetical protein
MGAPAPVSDTTPEIKGNGEHNMLALNYHSREHYLNAEVLHRENAIYQGTGGISQSNRSRGFLPAFMDTLSDKTYLSRFTDGRLAPIHLLEGLPEELVTNSGAPGNGRSIKNTVISGFVLNQIFYTRTQASLYMSMKSHLKCNGSVETRH